MIRKRIAGLGVALRAPTPETEPLPTLRALLDAFPPLDAGVTPDLDYTLTPTAEDQIRVQKWSNPPNTMPLADVMPTLQHDITVEAARGHTHQPLLHAAALERDGHVLLIPGESEAGKTTHAAALLRRGFRFLGDDLVLLDAEDRAQAVPFPLRIREAARARLEPVEDIAAWSGPPFYAADGQLTWHALPHPRLRVEVDAAFPVRAVISPHIQREGPTRLEPLRAGRAAFILMGAILNGVHLGEQGLQRAAALAQRAACFTLHTHDLDDALGCIEALWRSP